MAQTMTGTNRRTKTTCKYAWSWHWWWNATYTYGCAEMLDGRLSMVATIFHASQGAAWRGLAGRTWVATWRPSRWWCHLDGMRETWRCCDDRHPAEEDEALKFIFIQTSTWTHNLGQEPESLVLGHHNQTNHGSRPMRNARIWGSCWLAPWPCNAPRTQIWDSQNLSIQQTILHWCVGALAAIHQGRRRSTLLGGHSRAWEMGISAWDIRRIITIDARPIDDKYRISQVDLGRSSHLAAHIYRFPLILSVWASLILVLCRQMGDTSESVALGVTIIIPLASIIGIFFAVWLWQRWGWCTLGQTQPAAYFAVCRLWCVGLYLTGSFSKQGRSGADGGPKCSF